MVLEFSDIDLVRFKEKYPDSVILIADKTKNPGSFTYSEEHGNSWDKVKPQNADEINDLLERARKDKKHFTNWGIKTGVNDYWGGDFEWEWVYNIWKELVGERAETLTIRTANGGLRPVYLTNEVEQDWGEPFKNNVRFEIKNNGYVILGGKATDILGSPSKYQVVKELPVKRENEIIKESLKVMKKIMDKAPFLEYNCIKTLDKKIRMNHDQRLSVLAFMLHENWDDAAIHNFFKNVHEIGGLKDYKYNLTQDQIISGRKYIDKGGKPRPCTSKKDGQSPLFQIFNCDEKICFGCPRRTKSSNPLRFFNDKKFVPLRLSTELQEENRYLATSKKSPIWWYNPKRGIWEDTGEEHIGSLITEKLNHLWKSHYRNESEEHIRDGNYVSSYMLGGPPEKIVCLNGVLDLFTGDFTDFDPNLYAITQIPVKYDPNAKCNKIEQFFSEVVQPEEIPKLYEIIGYCLYKKVPIHRVIIFYGTGRNGKGTTLSLFTSFLGLENISTLNIQSLVDTGFRSANLLGKYANISGDLPNKPIEDTAFIKKLSGRDPVTLEQKFRDPFDTYLYTKMLFSANEVPRTKYDHTDAFFRRMLLIEYPYNFDDGNPNTDLNIIDKLTTPEELSGLLNKAVQGLANLLKRGKFANEKGIDERKKAYLKESDPIHYFAEYYVEQCLEYDTYYTNEELYKHYVFMCRKLGKLPKANNVFPRQFYRLCTYAEPTQTSIDKKQTKIVRGIKIKIYQLEKDFGEKLQDPPKTSLTIDKYNTVNTDNTDKPLFKITTEKNNNIDLKNSHNKQYKGKNRINRISRISSSLKDRQKQILELISEYNAEIETKEIAAHFIKDLGIPGVMMELDSLRDRGFVECENEKWRIVE